MNRAYRFRLYPDEEQKTLFAKTFGCVRFIYNKMLADRVEHYKVTGKSLHNTPAQYKTEFPWLKEVNSLALANAQLHLDPASAAFLRRPETGFPKFKAKGHSRASYSTNNQNGSVRFENGKIKLPKVGFVKVVQHRPIPESWKIKTVTVSKTPSGKYFVSVLLEYESQVRRKDVSELKNCAGLDFSMTELFVSYDAITAQSLRFYRQSQAKLARGQRKLSRCKKGSRNRGNQRLKVARLHEKVSNQRADFLHKWSQRLSQHYDMACIEDLNMQAMGQALNFGKSVSGSGWGSFTQYLAYKLEERGKRLVKVDKFFPSSQLCHRCGAKNPGVKNLSIREWTCPQCGAHHDRDLNAAINIREEGKRLLSA